MMHSLALGLAALAAILAPGAYAQQDYPSRPIRVKWARVIKESGARAE